MSKRQTARLENWSRVDGYFIGNVYEHPHLGDGLLICTSHIRAYDLDARWLKTRYTDYTLGEPLEPDPYYDPDYAEADHG